jgi:hypothetical protein
VTCVHGDLDAIYSFLGVCSQVESSAQQAEARAKEYVASKNRARALTELRKKKYMVCTDSKNNIYIYICNHNEYCIYFKILFHLKMFAK